MSNEVAMKIKLTGTLIRFSNAWVFCLLICLWQPANAVMLRVAVASNFLTASKALSVKFKKISGNTISISSGSTGKLYAQIVNGAPYDVFMEIGRASCRERV